jgi:hypothetical protein
MLVFIIITTNKLYNMSILNNVISIFSKSPKTPYQQCERVIRKLGYKKEDEGTFISESSSGTTMIWLSENGVKIKEYAHGYAETDYLPAPLTEAETLKSFIRCNEL